MDIWNYDENGRLHKFGAAFLFEKSGEMLPSEVHKNVSNLAYNTFLQTKNVSLSPFEKKYRISDSDFGADFDEVRQG